MKHFKKAAVLGICLSVVMTGTACSLFGGSGRLTPEKIYEELNKGDSEPCEDMDEILGDIDNKRAMLAGMFASFEGKDIKKTLKSEELNTYYADVGTEVLSELYTKNISRMTLYVQGEDIEDTNGNIKFAVCSMQFENDDEAWKYYKSCNKTYAAMIDATEDTSDLKYEQDGKLESTMTTINSGRNLVTYDVYIEGSCVMVLIGHAYKSNELTDRLSTLCERLSIPSTDVSKWDLLANVESDNRVMMAVEALKAEKIEDVDDDLPEITEYSGSPYYFVTDNPSLIEELGFGMIDDAEEITVLYNFNKLSSSRLTNMNGSVAYSLRCEDERAAEKIFNKVSTLYSIDSSSRKKNNDTGEEDGIKYSKVELGMSSSTVYYGFYLEDNMVYVICAYDKKSSSGSGSNYEELRNMMQLP